MSEVVAVVLIAGIASIAMRDFYPKKGPLARQTNGVKTFFHDWESLQGKDLPSTCATSQGASYVTAFDPRA
jgi:hypothetical protein